MQSDFERRDRVARRTPYLSFTRIWPRFPRTICGCRIIYFLEECFITFPDFVWFFYCQGLKKYVMKLSVFNYTVRLHCLYWPDLFVAYQAVNVLGTPQEYCLMWTTDGNVSNKKSCMLHVPQIILLNIKKLH